MLDPIAELMAVFVAISTVANSIFEAGRDPLRKLTQRPLAGSAILSVRKYHREQGSQDSCHIDIVSGKCPNCTICHQYKAFEKRPATKYGGRLFHVEMQFI